MNRIFALIITILISSSIANSQPDSLTFLLKDEFRPKIAVALSGGAARGLAQIGVLKAFDEAALDVDYLAGTSVGAIIGGLYASGYTAEEIDSIASELDWELFSSLRDKRPRENLFIEQKTEEERSLLTLHFDKFKFIVPEGISPGSSFFNVLQSLYWNAPYHPRGSFANLRMPFISVATDLNSGKAIYLNSGNLTKSVVASAAVPLRFAPVRIDSMILVDGGIKENVPVAAAKTFQPDLCIAVNTTSKLLKSKDINSPWNIADQIVSLSMTEYTISQLEMADYVIEPDLDEITNDEFDKVRELIEIGELEAKQSLAAIKDKIDSIRFERFFNYYFPRLNSLIPTEIESNKERLTDIYDDLCSGKMHSITINANSNVLNRIWSDYPILERIHISSKHGQVGSEEMGEISGELAWKYLNKPYNRVIQSRIYSDLLKILRAKKLSFAYIEDIRLESGILSILINESPLEEIEIKKRGDFSRFLIRRDLEFELDKPLNADDLLRSWQNLIASGYFSSLNFEIVQAPSGNSKVIIDYQLIGMQKMKIGGRADNERGAQLGVDMMQHNLMNIGARLQARLVAGTLNHSVAVTIGNPRFFSTMLSAGFTGYYKYRQEYSYAINTDFEDKSYRYHRKLNYAEDGYGFLVNMDTQAERLGRVGVVMRHEWQRSYQLDTAYKMPYYLISSLIFGMDYDSRDKAHFPTKGRRLSVSLETNLFNFDNAVSYSKLLFVSQAYNSYRNHTVFGGLMLGIADETLPRPELFSIGGINSFIGMRDGEMRGRQVVKGSFEYRYKSPIDLLFDTYLSLKYDLGAAWSTPEIIKFSGLRHGAGLVLALDTPFGPAKAGIGRSFYFIKNPDAVMKGEPRVYLSIGIDM